MKNALKLIVIIAFVAIIVFSFSSCPNDNGGGGSIPTRFIFKDTASASGRSVALPSRSMLDGTTWDEESFSWMNDYYDSLNDLVRSYTPTEFIILLTHISTLSDKWDTLFEIFDGTDIHPEEALIDFVNSFTFTPAYDLLAGSTTTAIDFNLVYGTLYYGNGDTDYVFPKITFTLDDNVPENHYLRFATTDGDPTYLGYLETLDGKTITVQPKMLLPRFVYSDGWDPFIPQITFYNGTEYKCHTRWKPLGEISIMGIDLGQRGETVFVPAAPLNIPSDATGVDIEVNWDLEDIIEQYQGPDKTSDTEDDVFVLARDFWQRLSMSFFIH